MNCNGCGALRWHPNKGFYCTIPDCKPDTSIRDVRQIYELAGIKTSDIKKERK